MRTLVAFLLLCSAAFGQTYYPTIVRVRSGQTLTMTKAGSPHIITGYISIESGTLVIDAGAEVVFTAYQGSIVLNNGYGRNLHVNGTQSDPVRIHSTGGASLGGINVVQSDITTNQNNRSIVRMSWCNWENLGGYSTVSTLDLRTADVDIRNCVFNHNSKKWSTTGPGISAGQSIGIICDCQIIGATTGISYYKNTTGSQSMLLIDNVDVIGSTEPVRAVNRDVTVSILGF